jgi:hypothetical protein
MMIMTMMMMMIIIIIIIIIQFYIQCIQFTVSRVKLDMSNSVYNPYLDSKNAQYINKVQYNIIHYHK